MSLMCGPDLLICDEPTSALDPEMTSEVLDLIAYLQSQKQVELAGR